jgi:filamentous hemagglutinin
VTAIGAAGGGVASGDTSGMVSAGNAARVEVENNAYGAIAGTDLGFWFGKTPDCDTACKANIAKGVAQGNLVVSAGEADVAGGMMIVAATPEIAAIARAALANCKMALAICFNNAGLQVAEAVTPGGIGVGGAIGVGKSAAEAAAAKAEAVAARLPALGQISLPSTGVGSNAAFSITNAQLGKKLGKHVKDFGGNPANEADRQRVIDTIYDIGTNPDKVVAGYFKGQGVEVGASRGEVFFRIKGNDVVVTKPDGSFVTILKDGINNTSVKNAFNGDPR